MSYSVEQMWKLFQEVCRDVKAAKGERREMMMELRAMRRSFERIEEQGQDTPGPVAEAKGLRRFFKRNVS